MKSSGSDQPIGFVESIVDETSAIFILTFFAVQSRDALLGAMGAADLFVLNSRNWLSIGLDVALIAAATLCFRRNREFDRSGLTGKLIEREPTGKRGNPSVQDTAIFSVMHANRRGLS